MNKHLGVRSPIATKQPAQILNEHDKTFSANMPKPKTITTHGVPACGWNSVFNFAFCDVWVVICVVLDVAIVDGICDLVCDMRLVICDL